MSRGGKPAHKTAARLLQEHLTATIGQPFIASPLLALTGMAAAARSGRARALLLGQEGSARLQQLIKAIQQQEPELVRALAKAEGAARAAQATAAAAKMDDTTAPEAIRRSLRRTLLLLLRDVRQMVAHTRDMGARTLTSAQLCSALLCSALLCSALRRCAARNVMRCVGQRTPHSTPGCGGAPPAAARTPAAPADKALTCEPLGAAYILNSKP